MGLEEVENNIKINKRNIYNLTYDGKLEKKYLQKKEESSGIHDSYETYLKDLIKVLESYDKDVDIEVDISENTINFLEYYNYLLEKIIELFEKYYNVIDGYFLDREIDKSILDEVDSLEREFKRFGLIKKFAKKNNTSLLIGKNGAGKSSLINYFKNSSVKNVIVIPAQKVLVFNKNLYRRNDINVECYLDNAKKIGNFEFSKDVNFFENMFERPFTELVTTLIRNYLIEPATAKREGRNSEITYFESMERIFEKIIPEIKFELNFDKNLCNIEKNGSIYDIDNLSDGEKAIIHYIGNVLLAPNNSYIFVDEPETYLNPAIYKKLWDILIEERSDCQFIFASHNIDFINSRKNPIYYWIENFEYPDNFGIREIDNKIEFPSDLLTELLGSRQKILFCEGTFSSYDYKIYSILFSDEYLIKPVGNHRNVIEYTKSFNKITNIHNNSSIGIIDGDNHNAKYIENLKSEKIYVLPFNEIEMFLLEENIVKKVLSGIYDTVGERENKFNEFKKKFFEKCNEKKEEMILDFLKKEIEEKFEAKKIENYYSLDYIKSFVDEFSNEIKVDELYDEKNNEIDDFIKDKEYKKLLKVCCLKEEVSKGLTNKYLDSNYCTRAIISIKKDQDLQKLLKEQYFNDI